MRRRGSGSGTVYKRKSDGRWVGSLSLGYDALGKPLRSSVYAATQAEAIAKLDTLKQAAKGGRVVPSAQMTVATLLDEWLSERVRGRVRASTYRDYQSIVDVHLRPALGRHKVQKLTPQDVQKMLNAKAVDLSPRRCQYIRTVLRMALKHGQRWGYVAQNVAQLTDVAPVRKRQVATLTAEVAVAIIRAVEENRDRHAVVVALATGLRQGEELGLPWSEVDLEAGTAHVKQTLQRLDGEYALLPPKTETSDRIVVLPAIAVEALEARKVEQDAHREAAGALWRDQWGLVFTTPFGKPLHGPTLTKSLQASLAKAGLPRMRFHDLRHGAATLMLGKGVREKVIQTILGHSTIAVTMDIYGHVIRDLHRDAAESMDQALRGAK